ncbi:hypothetical protein LIER_18250 [Lithospermum erythrorhizon]|uniref:Uncharacterized protein n=1 Tax=Lithospermum erythrorhizon TaxID=34254 RepID=A0AAV3QFV6_LITER
MPKRPRGAYPALTVETATGAPVRYTQHTLLDLRTISASTSSTPTDPSVTSRVRVSTHVGSSQQHSSHADRRRTYFVDEDTSGSDENGVGSDDVVAMGLDAAATTAPESSGQKKWRDWIPDPTVLEQYVRYWCQEDQMSVATQARQNRMISVGGLDGKCAVHALGSKGLHERIQEDEKRSRKTPSAVNILLGLNKKKEKTTDESTGDVYNPKLEKVYVLASEERRLSSGFKVFYPSVGVCLASVGVGFKKIGGVGLAPM